MICIFVLLGFPYDNFLRTLSSYSIAAENGIDLFNKTSFPIPSFDPNETLFIAQITPVIHYTLGGIMVILILILILILFNNLFLTTLFFFSLFLSLSMYF